MFEVTVHAILLHHCQQGALATEYLNDEHLMAPSKVPGREGMHHAYLGGLLSTRLRSCRSPIGSPAYRASAATR